jgi:hypothetical protein
LQKYFQLICDRSIDKHYSFLSFSAHHFITIKTYSMQQAKEAGTPQTSSKELSNALNHLKVISNWLRDVRKSLSKLQKEDFSQLPDTRMLKVHTHLRTNGKKPTIECPEITLRGNWLEKAGFSTNEQWVYVIAVDDMIIITPQPKKRSK